jgi:hypothetical protein
VGKNGKSVQIFNVGALFKKPVEATSDCEQITIPLQSPEDEGISVEGTGTIIKSDKSLKIRFVYGIKIPYDGVCNKLSTPNSK